MREFTVLFMPQIRRNRRARRIYAWDFLKFFPHTYTHGKTHTRRRVAGSSAGKNPSVFLTVFYILVVGIEIVYEAQI